MFDILKVDSPFIDVRGECIGRSSIDRRYFIGHLFIVQRQMIRDDR